MNIFLKNDPSLPVLPNSVQSYLRGLVQKEFCFNEVYVPIEKDKDVYVHNNMGVTLIHGGRVINDVTLINDIQNWYNSL